MSGEGTVGDGSGTRRADGVYTLSVLLGARVVVYARCCAIQGSVAVAEGHHPRSLPGAVRRARFLHSYSEFADRRGDHHGLLPHRRDAYVLRARPAPVPLHGGAHGVPSPTRDVRAAP